MTPPKKPEWFELRDNDKSAPRPEAKRFKRGTLLAVPFLIVGIGAVAAQISDEIPAERQSVVATANLETTTSSVTPGATVDTPVVTQPAPSAGDVPSIAKLPTKARGGDDDDFDDDDDEHEGRRHHGFDHDDDDDDDFEGDDD